MWLIKFGLILLLIAAGENVVAEPTIKPNWERSTQVKVNLSSVAVQYVLPGNESKDFPARPATNKNLYDAALYQNQPGFVLAEYVWDYKTKTLWMQDMLGSLQLRISVYQSDKPITNEPDSLKLAVEHITTKTYAPLNMADKIKLENFSNITSGPVAGLRYRLEVGRPNRPNTNYVFPLDDKHLIQMTFTIVESKERDRNDWYKHAEADIAHIVESLRIEGRK